jgi:hypothetical protein
MFSAMRTPLGCVLGLALAGLVLGACGDDDQPSTLPDVTPSTTSVQSPSATPSGDPTAQLEAESTAFFVDYIDTSNESWTSVEALERRRTMFADTCDACRYGYDLAVRVHHEGLRFEGDLGFVEQVRLDSFEGDVVRFSGFTSSPQAQLVSANGTVVTEFPPTDNLQVVYQAQRQASGQWILVDSEVLG